ncbi:helix-turn-helix domain-containing protein [Aquimarina aggregata]|uniref:helix-turn-helix domain-containing protein n=1 Tax=Aquimarina aggregata TaxID=1642818 RepID=UPI0024925D6A|nr:AraC family transcriptional regulator [Aquimarina aggregata]
MKSFELIDLILFLGISQGIFLAVTIQMIRNRNKGANKILSLVLLLAVLMLLGRLVYFKFLTPRFLQWTVLVDTVIFIFGPLCYEYFRRIAFANNDTFKLPKIHYLLALLHFLFFCYTISLSEEIFSKKMNSGFFRIPFFVIEGVGVIANFYYWILNFKLLKKYIKEEKNAVSYHQNLLSFLKFFQIAVGVFLMMWAINYIAIYFFNHSIQFIGYNSMWGAISIFIFVVGYYSLKEPELFRMPFQKEKVKLSKRLPQDEIISLGKKLDDLIKKEKIFLKPDLTLRDLAIRLNTSSHNVSWYLNTILRINFYDYINRNRVLEFLKRIEKEEHLNHTILAIAMEVGFNSKSTFNKAFKLEMNTTPSNYIKGLKAA